MKEKKIFILRTSDDRDRYKVYLDTLPLGPEQKPIKATTEDYKRNRSLAQQALMWIWHGQWSKHFGDTTDAEHIRFKVVYLLPVLLREDLVPGLDFLYSEAKAQELMGIREPIEALYRLISTTILDVSQFTEILNQYQYDAAEKGCFFTVRAPEYYEAMGIKQ